MADFCMGNVDSPLFDELVASIEPSLFDMAGRYSLPNPKGERCCLSLAFSGSNLDTGFEFTYGSESLGPPEEIIVLVEKALDLTDPWYQSQLSKRNRKKNKK